MDSFDDKFSEDKIPDRCKCFSSLKDECISEKDNLTSIDVWSVFKIDTMGGYLDLYLADVFEKFIITRLDYYRLDP